jgi:hypothetical protein
MIPTRENRSTWRETLPNATSSTRNHMWIGLGLNSSLQGERTFFYKHVSHVVVTNFEVIFQNLCHKCFTGCLCYVQFV